MAFQLPVLSSWASSMSMETSLLVPWQAALPVRAGVNAPGYAVAGLLDYVSPVPAGTLSITELGIIGLWDGLPSMLLACYWCVPGCCGQVRAIHAALENAQALEALLWLHVFLVRRPGLRLLWRFAALLAGNLPSLELPCCCDWLLTGDIQLRFKLLDLGQCRTEPGAAGRRQHRQALALSLPLGTDRDIYGELVS